MSLVALDRLSFHSKVCTKISLGGPQSGRYEELVAS